jgi:ankyrin repeat protein
MAVLSAASVLALWTLSDAQELARRFENAKPQITAIEVSLNYFRLLIGIAFALATELLDHGASIDARDRLGARPLSHAARFGHVQMVDLLLVRGAPINARNLAGATALYFAAEGGHTPIVQRLIERGADVKLAGRLVLCHRPDEPRT